MRMHSHWHLLTGTLIILSLASCGDAGMQSSVSDVIGADAATPPYGNECVTLTELEGLCITADELDQALEDGLFITETSIGDYLTGHEHVPVTFEDIQNIPDEISDGDNDTLGALDCLVDQIAEFDGIEWQCVTPVAVSESDVEGWIGDNGYLTEETDPGFENSAAGSITEENKTNWSAAHTWGDHSAAGYLTAETDPAFTGSPAGSITEGAKTNWSAAHTWGDHSTAGYLTAEADPAFTGSPAGTITDGDKTNWSAAHTWGDHSAAGYLTTETDSTFSNSPAGTIGEDDKTNWNTAHAWGNHADAGYLKVPAVMPGFVLRAGRAQMQGNGGASIHIPVDFGFTFDSPPFVVATSSVNGIVSAEIPTAHVTGIGTTGAQVRLYRTSGAFHTPTTYHVDWIAVGPGTQPSAP